MVRLAAFGNGQRLRLPLVLAAGLLCAVAGQTQPSDTVVNPQAKVPGAAAAGKAVFDSACAVCHSAGGTGGRGPALNTGTFSRGGEDAQLFATIHDGIKGSGMPSFAALPQDDIWRVVSYLRTLAPGGGSGGGAATTTAAAGNAANGRTLFFGKAKCSACHEVNGQGSDLGPDLSAVGAGSPDAIAAGMLHPPRRGRPTGRWVDIALNSGGTVRGYVTAEDSFNMVLRDVQGATVSVDRKTVRSVTPAPVAPPPTDLSQLLSTTEQADVVAYLSAQKARDVSGAIKLSKAGPPSPARLVASAAEPQNWLTYWGSYNSHHFSELKQVTKANVGGLQAQWAAALPGQSALQATPLVVDGIMYVAGSPGEVQAIDARTGLRIWRFVRKQDVVNPYQINPSNRGVAVMDGRVFVGTLDNLLIALDARTGRQLWEQRIANTLEGFTITGAPLAVAGKVMVGVGGGEYGLRAFLDSFDAATGKHLWRFNTVPGPGEPGNETWPGDTWQRGGAGVWLTGSYDPSLKLLYYGIGNPAPSFNVAVRAGDNLYSDSVVALDLETGKLRWHYQFTPNDSHDWDSEEAMVLVDRKIDGKDRKLLVHADRNGFYYTLDRTNGRFISGVPFVRQTWNDGFDAAGRPKVRPASIANEAGSAAFPGVAATNFQAPSYDKVHDRFYVAFIDSEGAIASEAPAFQKGKTFVAGRRATPPPPVSVPVQGIKALDATTGKELWKFELIQQSLSTGVLATRGGVVFAASPEGNLLALDTDNGKPLWHFNTGGRMSASPMSYAIDGRQYVAISAGNTVYSFALPQ
ncbi:PQQ-dependent dehydrogenase, methanol/ethanol family [Glacieibacterium sp.]|uniref:PQQ-dependent dehydrogenase, methanol/ethanol family n=1 Tax=Glacieibacterium sp. TaxID=2860237 RepID=UPI003B00EF16